MNNTESEPNPGANKSRKPAYITGGIVLGLGTVGAAVAVYTLTNPPAEIASPLFGNKSVTFDKKPIIEADHGELRSVTVKPVGGGERISGSLDAEGSRYALETSGMDFGTKYRVLAVAANGRGDETVRKATFRTFSPNSILATNVNVDQGATYGVGMPIAIAFSEPVQNRAKIEKRLKVTTDADKEVVGSWSWESDSRVTHRPKKYWPAKTEVTVTGKIKGLRVGNGVVPAENIDRTFKIGARQIIRVDSNTHQMIVKKNGEVVQQFPVSLGRPGDETHSGVKVLMSREQNITFDAATLGVPEDDPDYYKLEIAYAMRLTWSGEFIHSAPWSVGSQGYTNVSHGCTNVSTTSAAWLYENTRVGDIVDFQNTGKDLDSGNGITVWNESWRDWQSGSALQPTQG